MNSLTLYIIILVMINYGIIVLFRYKQRQIKKMFVERMVHLKEEISLNKKQIVFRDSALNRYSFITYNLNAILLVQKEIQI